MRIAITGGIGSGKSYVCQLLLKHGIKVYDCDEAAKRLMRISLSLQHQLMQLVGDDVYINKVLQKPVLAKFLLASDENKQAVNDIVHPAVALDYLKSDYEWLESAILFDSGFYKRVDFDKIVCVTAPLSIRVERVMERDNISQEKALEWIHRQLPQDEVLSRSDYEVVNDGKQDLEEQITILLNKIYK
jgi:dephospho-CoA kinase